MSILAIDPGVKGCGAAWFLHDGKLVRAWYEKEFNPDSDNWDVSWTLACVRKVLIEKPQTVGGRAVRGDANDLIALAMRIGELSALFRQWGAKVEYVSPRGWKGTQPKDICHKRVRHRLEAQGTLANVHLPKNKKLQLDVLDAVGIGLYAVFGKRW